MTSQQRPQAVPLMQSSLRFLITGAPAQWSEAKNTTADYRQWAWHVHHKRALRVCAVSSVVIMFSYLRAIEDTPLKLQICGMILLAVTMGVLTANRLPLPAPAAANWARQAIMLFSVLQCVMTINIVMGTRTPGKSLILFCPWWLDVATNLVVDVPCLALGDMRVKSWLVFLCMHIAVGVPFYISVQGYSLPFAIFKAAVIQGLSLITYTAIERPMCATYMRRFANSKKHEAEARERIPWAPNKQEQQERQAKDGHRGLAICAEGVSTCADPSPRSQRKLWGSNQEPQSSSTVSSCSVCRAAAEQPDVRSSADSQEGHGAVLHPGVSAQPPTSKAAQLPAGWAVEMLPKGLADLARNAARAPDARSAYKPGYASKLRRSRVSIKLRSSFGPEKLCPAAPAQLSQCLASRSPSRLVVDVAVRHGCIMLSMDVCELQRITQERGDGQAGLSQAKITQEIIQQWLLNSGLQDILEDGTALAIQVDGRVLECTYSAQANAWKFSTESVYSSRDLYSIMVPDFVLLYPSQTSHVEDHQQQQQQEQRLNLKAYISAPSEFHLIGWQGTMRGQSQSQAQGDTLQLLARSQGRFLDIEILHLGDRDESGGQSVLACVTLSPAMVAWECCQLRLELMRGDALLCNYNTMLARSDLYPEVQDVKGWSKPPRTPLQISAFVEDLAEYLSFQSLLRQARNRVPALMSCIDEGQAVGSAGRALALDSDSNSDSLLSVLLAEACRPEMLQMMAEVSMDLLQHAVSWGMVHLAERILSGMLNPPLSIPFAAIASCNTSVDCDAACPTAQPSLLLYALLSEDAVMFERVVGWGQLYGGPLFTWDSNGSGATGSISSVHPRQQKPPTPTDAGEQGSSNSQLLHMEQALPSLPPQEHLTHSHAAALNQQLGGGAATATAAVGVQRAWGAKQGDAGALQLPVRQRQLSDRQLSGGQPVGSPQSSGGTAATAAAAATPKSVAALSNVSSGSSMTPSSGPSRRASSSQVQALMPAASHGSALVSVARALAMGFGEQGDIKESQYRAWCTACCVGLANKVRLGVVPFFWLQAALSLSRGLYKSAFTLALYPVPMFLALISRNPKKRETCMFWAKIFHLGYYIIFGLGLMPTIVARKLAITHLDLIVEVILCRLLWQVQLRALLVERVVLTIGSSMLYSRLQFQQPLLQALAINFASVCIGIALDVRNRRMYVHMVRAGALLSQRGKKVQ